MNIRDFDLNLLHVFQAVHAQRNVSRAAEQFELSQPAASHALTRLRLLLHDPLFVRAPGGVMPTAKADQFARQVESALKQLDVAIHEADTFDPARSQRRFAVHMSDIGADEFLPQIMARGRPRRARCAHRGAYSSRRRRSRRRSKTAASTSRSATCPSCTGTESARLLDERYVVLLRRGHPLGQALKDRSALQQLELHPSEEPRRAGEGTANARARIAHPADAAALHGRAIDPRDDRSRGDHAVAPRGALCAASRAAGRRARPRPAEVHRVAALELALSQRPGQPLAARDRVCDEVHAAHSVSPHGSIIVTSSSFSNSGSKRSMISCGSGHSLRSVINPNCTPPA